MSLKVIGAGLGRTSTLSLKVALEKVGFGPCYHMMELIENPQRLRYWKELHATRSTDFEALFDGYQSAVDNPACIYYKELFQKYPDAKVVLTVRDPEKWYESTMKTIYEASGVSKTFFGKLGLILKVLTNAHMRKSAPVFQYADQAIWESFFSGKIEDKAFAIDRFHQHTEEVKAAIPPDQLLIFEAKEGWEPLCNFLGVAVPDEPYPRVNQGATFKEDMDKAMTNGQVLGTFVK